MHTGSGARVPDEVTARDFSLQDYLAILQGLYYATTGLWALVSIQTFQRVTGPKSDLWLVKTVGTLITVIGGVMMTAGLRRRSSSEISLLATGSAGSLAAIDVIYVARGRISPVYLLDAVAEAGLIAAWLLTGAWRAWDDRAPGR